MVRISLDPGNKELVGSPRVGLWMGRREAWQTRGELVWRGWKFWEDSSQVIYVSLEEFQLMACCRSQVLMGVARLEVLALLVFSELMILAYI